jgi:hypothetical protein
VNILVKSHRNQTRAVNALKALYPRLEVRRVFGVMTFFVPGEKNPVIDVAFPFRPDLAETLANVVEVEDRGLKYRISSLETALANKYGAMRTTTRGLETRCLDMADFMWMVVHSLDEGQQPINMSKLEALGDMVWPGRGGEEILRLVELVKSRESFDLDDLIQKTD